MRWPLRCPTGWRSRSSGEQASRRGAGHDLVDEDAHQGVLVQRWTEGDVSHFLLTTLWDSIDSIKRFAGEDYAAARYYPEDDEFLLEREPRVTHTTVLMAVMPGAVP